MEQRVVRPASREQVVAIIRQRVERFRQPAGLFDDRMLGAMFMQAGQPAAAAGYPAADQLGAAAGAVPVRAGRGEFFRQASIVAKDDHRSKNVTVEGDVIGYLPSPDSPDAPGVFVSGKPLTAESNYFEVEILEKGLGNLNLHIGLVSRRFSLESVPGHVNDSVAFCPADRALFAGRPVGSPFGATADVGDKVGCGVRFAPSGSQQRQQQQPQPTKGSKSSVSMFVTVNGKEVGSVPIQIPPGGFHPAVSLKGVGEEIAFRHGVRFSPEEDIMMLVDSGEDDWLSLHDVRLNGPVLEYVGRGKSLVDVGLAQAKHPVSTRNHYFEIEIIDPGLSCFIAIGLARKDYPKNRHPGWNRGSIAYHADDGKVFAGSGVGAPFGPPCHKGDIMGCGVLFPRNYECRSDSEDELEQQAGGGGGAGVIGAENQYGGVAGIVQNDYASDSDDDWWNDRNYTQNGVKVNIYFTRNGVVIGKKEVRIPKGGFYPTVGMMSSQEKVRVDLRPLSG